MAIVINGSGTVTGISVGGLPDNIVDSGTLASDALDSAVTINDTGADVDFRVESDDNANMIFVDGGNDSVGIGTGSPSSQDGEADDLVVGTGTGHNGITIYAGTTSKSKIHFSDGTSGADCYRGVIGYNHNNDSLAIKVGAADSSIDLHSDGRGVSQFTAKAWLDFRGTTNVIHDSHNISSVTDESTGTFLANFSNNMANANHCGVAATQGSSTNTGKSVAVTDSAVGSRRFETYESDSATDPFRLSYIGFGD